MQNPPARPWFRLASIRVESPPDAASSPPDVAPPAPPPQQQPPPERPLRRFGSLLIRTPAAAPPAPQEPTQPPTRVLTPPPPAPTSPPPPTTISTAPLSAAATQDQQPPRQVSPAPAPAPVVRAPSPRVPTPPPSPARVIRPSEPTIAPLSPQVTQQQPPPQTAVALPPPPPPTVTVAAPSPAPTPPRRPSPPLHPEPETKPVVSAQPAVGVQEPINGPYRNNNGGKTKSGTTQGDQRGATPPPIYSYSTVQKKPDTVAATAAPWKKKSATEEMESGMRFLTLAGENLGAHMNLGGGGRRGGSKVEQIRDLTQPRPAQEAEKIAPGNKGVKSYTAAAKDKAAETAESRWKVSASPKPMATLVNSNVQSVNNSILFNSSCRQQSPGVHITLSSGRRCPRSPTPSDHHAGTTTATTNHDTNSMNGAPGDN